MTNLKKVLIFNRIKIEKTLLVLNQKEWCNNYKIVFLDQVREHIKIQGLQTEFYEIIKINNSF